MSEHLNGLEGMTIGGVDPVHITADTPIDYSQWQDGKPWHTLLCGEPLACANGPRPHAQHVSCQEDRS